MLKYSPIWLRIINFRAKSNPDGNRVDNLIYLKLKHLQILRERKRGTRGGTKRKSRKDCRLCGKGVASVGCNFANLIDVNTYNSNLFSADDYPRDSCLCEKILKSPKPVRGPIISNLRKVHIYQNFSKPNLINLSVVNAQSLRNKTLQISEYITDNDIDICFITETWLKEGDEPLITEATPINYNFSHIDRENRSGGGIALVSKTEYNSKVKSTENNYSFEISENVLWSKNISFLCVVIYRPPYSQSNPVNLSTFLRSFREYLSSIIHLKHKLLIAGDFNIHIENKNDIYTNEFLEILDSFDLVNHIFIPTHAAGHTLDLLLTKKSDIINIINITQGIFLSDHSFILCQAEIHKPKKQKIQIEARKLKSLNELDFSNDLITSKIQDDDFNTKTVNEMAILMDKELSRILDRHVPKKLITITMRPNSPWFTPDLQILKKEKRQLEQKWLKSKSDRDKQIFSCFSKHYYNIIKQSKTNLFSQMVKDCEGDQKKLYNLLNQFTYGRKETIYPSVPSEQLVEEFGYFFTNKVENIVTEINACNIRTVDSLPENDPILNENKCFSDFPPLNEGEVREIITKSSNKTCNLDFLPVALIKKFLEILLKPITLIINKSLATGQFPETWKNSLVTPIPKKINTEALFKNFRPISNLSFFSKLIEKSALLRYIPHLNNTKKFAINNSAYKPVHSTETLITKVNNDIMVNMDTKKFTLLVLLDLSAAFDTVDQKLLLNILHERFNIINTAKNWMKDYLSNRSQKIQINKFVSSSFDVNHGVPQGSCIGPIGFLMYISGLSDIISKYLINMECYADDTQLYLEFQPSIESINTATQNLESCIAEIRNYLLEHQLKFNESKTEIIIIGSKYNFSKLPAINFSIGNEIVTPVSSVRNLGVIFDSHMTLNTHINNICKKVNIHLSRIRHIRPYLSKSNTETLIHSLITSTLDYCNSILYNLPENQLHKLQLLQNSAARLIHHIPRRNHITPILKKLNWLPVKYRVEFKIALLSFKILNGLAPQYLMDMVRIHKPTRVLRSSSKNLLVVPRIHNKYGSRSFSYACPVIWNGLPNELRSCDKLSRFKMLLKTHLFSKAYINS